MKHMAMITGSYGGLGTCFAEILAKRGYSLLLVGRDAGKLSSQETGLKRTYDVDVSHLAVDLSEAGAANAIFEACKREGYEIEVLINNAGFGGQGDFARERSMEDDMAMMAVNMETPTRLLKLFLPAMIERGRGHILNVSSTAAFLPGPLQAVYYATKAYLTSFSNALWRELKGTGVTVTALMPGAMKTGFIEAGGLSDTKLFKEAGDPMRVAEEGIEGMLEGKINVVSGLVSWQKPFMKLAPMFPKKAMLDFVYEQQVPMKR